MDILRRYGPLLILVAAAAAAWLWISAMNRARDAEGALAREREATLLAGKNIVERDATIKDLRAMADSVPGLKTQIAELQGRVGEVNIVEVVRWRTKEGPVLPPPSAEPSPAGCACPQIEEMEIRGVDATASTKAGNRVVVGQAECVRTKPPPEWVMFRGPFDAPLSEAMAKAEEVPTGWGFGVMLGGTRDGWATGPVVAAPPWRFWRLQIEAQTGVGLGPSGGFQGTGSLVGRWR